jgi:hypothetical protein
MSCVSHHIAQGPWHLIREFAGIYQLDVNYSKIQSNCLASEVILAGRLSGVLTNKKVIALRGGIGRNPDRFIKIVLKEVVSSPFKKAFYQEIANIMRSPSISISEKNRFSRTKNRCIKLV